MEFRTVNGLCNSFKNVKLVSKISLCVNPTLTLKHPV